MVIIKLREQYIKLELLKLKNRVALVSSVQDLRVLYAEYCKLNIFLMNNISNYEVDYELFSNDFGNCYTYALGLDCPNVFYKKFEEFEKGYRDFSIGFISNPMVTGDLCRCSDFSNKLMFNLIKDLEDLQIEYFDSDFGIKNIHGGSKIAIFYNNGFICRDFHVIRENIDGSWSEKCGYGGNVQIIDEPQNNPYHLLKVLELKKPKIK